MVYSKFLKLATERPLVENMQRAVDAGVTVIVHETEGSANENDPVEWKEISKVEVLIEMAKGAKLFRFSDTLETWVEEPW